MNRLQLMRKPTKPSTVSTANKSVQHSDLPATTETSIQTSIQTKESNIRDIDREDLLEFLRELVVMPQQHLDSVMEKIEDELGKPDVNYSKMLRHVHKYSAMEVRRSSMTRS